MFHKIVLGTVQFGQDYGIANTTGKVTKEEALKILECAESTGVRFLDTAFAYGDSERVIGHYLRSHPDSFRIVSKLPPVGEREPIELEKQICSSLNNLGAQKLYGYLAHRFDDIRLHEDFWEQMESLKTKGYVEKIGFSLYSPDELAFLLEKGINFDILQIPYNVFDRRFENYFGILKERHIEIQARSVFLQGLFFLDSSRLPEPCREAGAQLERLRQISIKTNIPIGAICLNFVMANPFVDKVLIGVDSLEQFKCNLDNLAFATQVLEIYDQLSEIRVTQEEVLLPFKWNL